MRYEPRMSQDERSPEQIKQDRLRRLREDEAYLKQKIAETRDRIADLLR